VGAEFDAEQAFSRGLGLQDCTFCTDLKTAIAVIHCVSRETWCFPFFKGDLFSRRGDRRRRRRRTKRRRRKGREEEDWKEQNLYRDNRSGPGEEGPGLDRNLHHLWSSRSHPRIALCRGLSRAIQSSLIPDRDLY
jgi:hypothetical protein